MSHHQTLKILMQNIITDYDTSNHTVDAKYHKKTYPSKIDKKNCIFVFILKFDPWGVVHCHHINFDYGQINTENLNETQFLYV